MKKKLTKIILIITVTVALVCCCCFSVYAANYDLTISSFDFAIYDSDTASYIRPGAAYDGTWVNSFPLYEHFGSSMWMMSEVPSMSSASKITWDINSISYWNFSSSRLSFITINLVMWDENFTPVYNTILGEFYSDEYQVTTPAMRETLTDFQYADKVKYIGLNIVADFNFRSGDFYFTAVDLKLSVRDAEYALQEDINDKLGSITADKYIPPSGGDQIGDLTDTESQINENTSQGLNAVTDSFKAFSMSFFYDGLGGCIQLFNRIVPNIPWLNQILIISLGLGMFAFLVGSAQIVVGRLNSDMPRSARHDAKYIKRDGIASHRPSRK